MVRETELNARDFIYPLFVRHGDGRSEIRSMPGVYQLSVAEAVREAETAMKSGVNAVILFGIPAEKDPVGLENFADDGIVQQAIRAIKKEIPEMVVVTDVCLCEYTDHGHCGILNRIPTSPDVGNPKSGDFASRILTYPKATYSTTQPWMCWQRLQSRTRNVARTLSRRAG